jgi:hypothetical protein
MYSKYEIFNDPFFVSGSIIFQSYQPFDWNEADVNFKTVQMNVYYSEPKKRYLMDTRMPQ